MLCFFTHFKGINIFISMSSLLILLFHLSIVGSSLINLEEFFTCLGDEPFVCDVRYTNSFSWFVFCFAEFLSSNTQGGPK